MNTRVTRTVGDDGASRATPAHLLKSNIYRRRRIGRFGGAFLPVVLLGCSQVEPSDDTRSTPIIDIEAISTAPALVLDVEVDSTGASAPLCLHLRAIGSSFAVNDTNVTEACVPLGDLTNGVYVQPVVFPGASNDSVILLAQLYGSCSGPMVGDASATDSGLAPVVTDACGGSASSTATWFEAPASSDDGGSGAMLSMGTQSENPSPDDGGALADGDM